MKLYWAKVKENAIIPQKRKEDAGYDLYPCFEEDYLEFAPFETKIVPLGVASAFDDNCVMILKERGSTGTRGMAVRAGVMDSGYRGEYLAPITNLNEKPLLIIKKEALGKLDPEKRESAVIYPYEKACAQAVLLLMPQAETQELSLDQLLSIDSDRKDGRLGSSGK